MKRALALLGAMTALTLATAGSASAACIVPYCPAPTAVATGASNISSGSATLNGTVNSNSGGPAYWRISIGSTVIGSGTIPDTATTVPVSVGVNGLTASSTYTYTVTVTNLQTSSSASSTFTTTPLAGSGGDNQGGNNQGGNQGGNNQGGNNQGGGQPSTSPGEPSTSPTTTPPAPTTTEKKDAAAEVQKSLPGTATFETQVGSALVFVGSDAPVPSKSGKVTLLALTADPGAKVDTSGSVKLDNGKTLTLPKAVVTVGKDGKVVVTVRLTKAQEKALLKAGGGIASVQIQVTDQYGTHTQTVKVDLLAKKPAKKKTKK